MSFHVLLYPYSFVCVCNLLRTFDLYEWRTAALRMAVGLNTAKHDWDLGLVQHLVGLYKPP